MLCHRVRTTRYNFSQRHIASLHAILCRAPTQRLISVPLRQDMVYEPCELLTRSKVVTEMPFPRIATLLLMKLEDIITGLEQMIAGAPGKQ